MTYFRNNRAVQILIESLNDNNSRITITAVPNQTTNQGVQNNEF